MIMGDNNQKPNMNPFSKVSTLRGFNNTPENIRNQMNNARDPWNKKVQQANQNQATQEPKNLQKPAYDPSKQRETMIRMDHLH